MSLRTLLLIIGVCLIAGIYLWEVTKRKQRQKRRSEVVFEHELTQDRAGSLKSSADTDAGEAVSISGGRTAAQEVSGEDIRGLSISAKRERQADVDEQIPLILHDVIESDDKPVTAAGGDADDAGASPVSEDDLLILAIAPVATEYFQGLDILTATKAAGMKFGNMNIFHHYGVGEMKTDASIFSLANLYEPGEFDLQGMESFSTRGLILYMCLPTAIDAEVALELMLNTAQRIADSLGGQVCDRLRKPLTESEIEKMRARLKHYRQGA